MAEKRNLEGNTSTSNSFATLQVEEIISIIASMGVDMSVNDFDTFNLLKDLEIARDNLYHKQKK